MAVDKKSDEDFMRIALAVAQRALEVGEVPVGCIIVLNNHPSFPADNECVVISHGGNQVNATRDATRHAEIVAIDRILTKGGSSDELRMPQHVPSAQPESDLPVYPKEVRRAREIHWDDTLRNMDSDDSHWKNSYGWGTDQIFDVDVFKSCTLYVTCEPCIMCAAALGSVGISRVVFGCRNPRFGGCGSLVHLHNPSPSTRSGSYNGYKTTHGVLEEEALVLLRSFYDRENCHAPIDKRKKKDAST